MSWFWQSNSIKNIYFKKGNKKMYCELKEPFDKKYVTWIIAYCPDNNSWFTTNERGFYYEHPDEFQCENDAITYFEQNVGEFFNLQAPMNHWSKDKVNFETTKYIKVYRIEEINGNCCYICEREIHKDKM